MDTIQQFVVPAMIALFGLGSIAGGLFGTDFHWKALGSNRVGPAMPGWFARPFFVLIGIVLLATAGALWRQK